MLPNTLNILPGTGAGANSSDRQKTDLAIVSLHVRRRGVTTANLGYCAAGSDHKTQADYPVPSGIAFAAEIYFPTARQLSGDFCSTQTKQKQTNNILLTLRFTVP